MRTRRAFLALAAAALAACAPKPPAGWSGYAEGEYVYVAPGLGGTLERLAVARGAWVEAGALLFSIEATAEDAARAEAEARAAAARAQAANADKGRRAEEIEVTQAQLDQARSQAALAARELARQRALVAQGFVSAARIDEAQSALRQAQARVDELTAALRVAALPARSDERAAAAAQARAAEEALRQSAWREAQKTRRATVASRVADTFFREGEWVNAGQPVLALLPPAGVKARFFVPQAELAQVPVGRAVELRCDGCAAPIAARVAFVAPQAEYTPPVIYSNAQRARLVFLVEARPAPADAAKLSPGQPLDVTLGPPAAADGNQR